MTAPGGDGRICVRLATADDREAIYRLRHVVYACELGQHPPNAGARLTDALDAHNLYLVAAVGNDVAGFISVTPPGRAYSLDKYLPRDRWPFACDDGLYEIRLLTVAPAYRTSALGSKLAAVLMHAAARWVEESGGRHVAAIGRRELLGLYRRVGFRPLGHEIRSGAVTFELMGVTVEELRRGREPCVAMLCYLRRQLDWRLAIPFLPGAGCAHGGAFFGAVGEDFDHLERRDAVINADVLDAWFPPAPGAIEPVREHLPWLARTSPPPDGAGLVRAVAQARGVGTDHIVLGAGSSDLMYRVLSRWLTPGARVLLPDPTYGEYAHLCTHVIGCRVDRLALRRCDGYRLDPEMLGQRLAGGAYDLAVVVNPNNPTGRHVPRRALEAALRQAPTHTRVWVDEAYIDYVGPNESIERFAAATANVVACKSLSKAYALSGLRAAYLCGSPAVVDAVRAVTPPWVVSLPAQVAAVGALQDPAYYAARYAETHALRERLAAKLRALDARWQILPGVANYLLCHLPEDGPDATTFVSRCQAHGLFLRDLTGLGAELGRHAVRIAVKDEAEQEQMLEILSRVRRPDDAAAGPCRP